ncbi:MAG: metallophosphoesterase [Bacteroidales bacterium]
MKTKVIIIVCVIALQTAVWAQFSFVHITDLHVANGLSAGGYDLNGVMFKTVRDNINSLFPKPAFVIATGDISHAGEFGSDGMYPSLIQYLYPANITNPGIGAFFIDSLQTIPIYFTPGNHDFRYANTPPLSNQNLAKYMSYICSVPDYFVIYQNAVIICMNSGYDDLRPLWEDSNFMSPESSGFSNEQLNWLRGILISNYTKRKIIMMHSPPVNKVGFYCDGTAFTGYFVDFADGSVKYNRDVFLNICDSNHVDVVLAGHAHQNIVSSRSGVTVNENWPDSTRYVQTGASLDGCYRLITVDSAFVSVGYPQTSDSSVFIETLYSKEKIIVEIYPNPFSESTTLEIIPQSGRKIQNYELKIYDLFGREVRKYEIRNQKTEISRDDLSSGMYFYQVKNKEQNIGAEKLIIQ